VVFLSALQSAPHGQPVDGEDMGALMAR